MIKNINVLTVLFMIVISPLAQAATTTFDNNSFSVNYVFGSSPTAPPLQTSTVTGSAASPELTNFWSWQIDTSGNSLTLTWNKQSEFMNDPSIASFIGIRISDTNNQLADITGISITNGTYIPATFGNLLEGFGASNLTFDANNIYINFNTSMWHDFMPVPGQMGDTFRDKISLQVNFQAAPIPEADSYAMFIAGLSLMTIMIRRHNKI